MYGVYFGYRSFFAGPPVWRTKPVTMPQPPADVAPRLAAVEAARTNGVRRGGPAGTGAPHHTLLLTFTLIWGANFVLAEVALREMAPISFSVARFMMGGLVMFGVLYMQYRMLVRRAGVSMPLLPKIDRKDWPRLLLISVLGATLAPWLGIEGLGLTHGARASLWLALGPALSSIIGRWFRTERIGGVGYVGIGLAGLGTFALAADGLNPGRDYWGGDALLCAALLLMVLELHLIKPLAVRYGASVVVTLRTLIGGTLYLFIALPSMAQETWFSLGAWTWIAILAGGGIGVGIGQWVKVRALHTLGPTRVVLYGNLVPLAAIGLAWLALGTVPSLLEAVAGVLIISGALLLQVIDGRAYLSHSSTPPSA